MNGSVWAKKRTNEYGVSEWWYAQTDDNGEPILASEPVDGVWHPPSFTITVPKDPEYGCYHFYSYSNGVMPDDQGDYAQENTDYLHICDLDDFIAELCELRDALKEGK